jgi:hypothetical protein
MYVLSHSMHIIHDKATMDEAAFIVFGFRNGYRHGVLLQFFLYSKSRVERIQQFKKVTYMAHPDLHKTQNLDSWPTWLSLPREVYLI